MAWPPKSRNTPSKPKLHPSWTVLSKLRFFVKKSTATEGDLTALKNEIIADYSNGKYEDFVIELDVEESPKPMGLMDGAIAEINIGGMFEYVVCAVLYGGTVHCGTEFLFVRK